VRFSGGTAPVRRRNDDFRTLCDILVASFVSLRRPSLRARPWYNAGGNQHSFAATMSIAHRSIARLPLTVFDIKKDREHDGNVDHGEGRDIDAIRRDICSKLKSMPRNKSSRSSSVTESVSTVGELLQQSPVILLRALDPLLTYGKDIYDVVAKYCNTSTFSLTEFLTFSLQTNVFNSLKTQVFNVLLNLLLHGLFSVP
jgi:hypothetical protein